MLCILSLAAVALPGARLADADPAQPASAGDHLLLLPDTAKAGVALARADARVIARYQSFALVEARGQDEQQLRDAGAERRDDMRSVRTAAGSVDPAERPSLAAKRAPDRDEVLALVQFVGPPKDAWLERLSATGAEIVTYQAENAYLVHAQGEAVDRLASLVGTDTAVRAITPVTVADKLEGVDEAPARYAVSTVAGDAGAEARGNAAATGPVVAPPATVGHVRTQYVELSADAVSRLASDPAVVAIERDALPRPHDERAAQIVAGNLAPPSFTQPRDAGYLAWRNSVVSGPFPTIDVTDTGLDNGADPPAHPDFADVAYRNDYTSDDGGAQDAVDCTGHGTNVASIAAGSNTTTGGAFEDVEGFNYGLGVAPSALVGASKIFDCGGQGDSFSTTALTSAAYAGGARVSNNSWGSGSAITPDAWGAYTTRAAQYDQAVRDAQAAAGLQPLVEVFSAGNDGLYGGNTLSSEATAKNVITVGASESVRAAGEDGCGVTDAEADNANQIVGFSSRGPTDDGRLKPDLVAPGTHVTGARPTHAGFNPALEGTCNPFFAGSYSLVSGTSQAAPEVTGAAALVRKWYDDLPAASAPSPALTKALLINTATDLAGGPNVDQGWGRINLGSAFDSTVRAFYDQQPGDVLTTSGQTVLRSFAVPDLSRPVKVTLVWTDPPGSTTGNAFVNNLDLEVAAGGRRYLGNVFDGSYSRTGGSADVRNNVESVFLPAGTGGHFSVTVRGTTLAGDGVPGSGDTTDQDFALVVSNAVGQAAPVLTHESTTIHDADGDGALESDEPAGLTETVRNAGTQDATGVSASLAGGPGLAIGGGGASYPTVAADGGLAANSPDFTAQMANAAPCGADLSATLAITAGSETQSVPLLIPTGEPGPALTSASSQVPLTIPDNDPTGVASSVFVGERGRIKDLNVAIPSITHGWVGDLVIDVTGPDGTTVRLADHPGGPDNGSDNLSGTVFDDEAGANISSGSAPYSGNFRPQNDQLSRFDGKSRRGTWTLRVRDTFITEGGTLSSWSVQSQKALCDVDTTPPDTAIGGGPGSSTTSTSAQFTLGSNDPGATYECRLDLAAYAPCDPAVALSGLALGTHSLNARAIDGSDNEDPTPATYSWAIVSPQPPTPATSFVLAPTDERLSDALAGRYRVLAACASACKMSAKLTVSGRTARKLKLGRRTTTLGTASQSRRSAGTVAANLRLSKAARKALRARKGTKATLSVTLRQGSSTLRLKRTVSLLRGGGLARIASRGVKLWAVCARSGPLSGRLSISAREARRIGIRHRGTKRLEIASGRATAGLKPKVLTLAVKRSVRGKIRRARRLGAVLEATAGRSPNPVRRATLSKTLRR